MTRTAAALARLSIATAIGGAALLWNGDLPLTQHASLVSSAEARIGRPATPRSFAGVARRTDRRVTRRFVVGAAAGTAAVAGAAFVAAPAAAAASTMTAASVQQSTPAQIGAVRSSCRADYQVHCAGVPTGGRAALQCLQKNVASLSSACQTAVNAVGGTAKPAAAAAAAADTEAAPAPAAAAAVPSAAEPAPPVAAAPARPVHRSLTPRQELAVLRFACGPDFRALCDGVPLGGGRVIGCLRENSPSLSPRCRGALTGAL